MDATHNDKDAVTYSSTQLQLRAAVGAGNRHTLVVIGEVDIATADPLTEAVQRICAQEASALTLDLRQVTFMDSTGLRATLTAWDLCKQHGREFSIIPGPQQVLKLFELTGLVSVLPFAADDST